MKSFDPSKVEVQVHKEFVKYSAPEIIQKAIEEVTMTSMTLRRNLATLYGCEIEDTEIVLDVEDEFGTKLKITARLKKR